MYDERFNAETPDNESEESERDLSGGNPPDSQTEEKEQRQS